MRSFLGLPQLNQLNQHKLFLPRGFPPYLKRGNSYITFFFFEDRVSSNPSWSQTFVAKDKLALQILPFLLSEILELQAHITILDLSGPVGGAQGCLHARQALCKLGYIPSPILNFVF